MTGTAERAPHVRPVRRDPAVDRLKVGLTIAVITTHAALTYGVDGDWFYRERGPDGAFQAVLGVLVAVGALFAMGAFFFLAGCFVPGSLARKGTRRFVIDRLWRLGVPVLVFVIAVVPAIDWLVGAAAGPRLGAGTVWREQLRRLDTGPLWFAAVLLLASLIVAVSRPPLLPLTTRALVCCAGLVAVLSFVLRLRFAIGTAQILSAHVWQWGQCFGLFALGVAVGPSGLDRTPAAVLRWCRRSVAVGLTALALLLATSDGDLDPFGGGPHWQAAALALVEGAVAVGAPFVLLNLARRPRRRPRFDLAGAAFGAYVLQAPVLVVAALAISGWSAPPALKFAVVAAVSVAACFVLAGALRRSTRPAKPGAPAR